MILIINTTPGDRLEIILAEKKDKYKVKSSSGKFNQAEKLLPAIDSLLKSKKITAQKLRAIGVVTGPGGFTAVRIGVAVANGLGYGLNLSVVGIKANEFKNNDELVAKIFELVKVPGKRKLAMPYYDREPNITMKKK